MSFYFALRRVQSILMDMSAYLTNHTAEFDRTVNTCSPWSWLGNPLMELWYVTYFRISGWRHVFTMARRVYAYNLKMITSTDLRSLWNTNKCSLQFLISQHTTGRSPKRTQRRKSYTRWLKSSDCQRKVVVNVVSTRFSDAFKVTTTCCCAW